jgi:hypothetical protein
MEAKRKNLQFTALIFVAIAQFMGTAAHAAVVQLNGTCEVGSCSTLQADALTFGTGIGTTPFNFNYTFANTDEYAVSGTYSASYGASGSLFSVTLGVTYLGNSSSGPSQADSFDVDVLQDIFDNGPGTFDGTYTESVPVSIFGAVGPGSSVAAQLLWDGQSVGLIGPFVGDGTYSGSNAANLTGLTGDYLDGDFQFIYNFAAGTQAGAGSSVASSTPEPAETIPAALIIGAALVFINYKKQKPVIQGGK